MSILDKILSVAVPVANIGAQLLPQILQALPESTTAPESSAAPVPVFKTGFVAWLPDLQNRAIMASNMLTEPLTLTFGTQNDVDGEFGVESYMTQIPALHVAMNLNPEFEAYGDGSTGAVPSAPSSVQSLATDDRVAPPRLSRIFFTLRSLLPPAFLLFGGNIRFERRTVRRQNSASDQWIIGSRFPIREVKFDYESPEQGSVNFELSLEEDEGSATPSSAGSAPDRLVPLFPNNYRIEGLSEGAATGDLSSFNLSVVLEEDNFNQLVSPIETMPIEQLPPAVRDAISTV